MKVNILLSNQKGNHQIQSRRKKLTQAPTVKTMELAGLWLCEIKCGWKITDEE